MVVESSADLKFPSLKNLAILYFVRNNRVMKRTVLPAELQDEINQVEECFFDKDPFSRACENGCLGIVKFFVFILKHDVSSSLSECLKKASQKGHVDITKILLMQKGCTQEMINGAFIEGAKENQYDVVDTLLQHGADVQESDDLALISAAKGGRLDLIKLYFQHGANIHAENDLCLREAVSRGCFEVAQFLIENGGRVAACDNFAFRIAVKNRYKRIATMLLEAGADVNARSGDLLCLVVHDDDFGWAKWLISKGADVHAHNDLPLRYAAELGNLNLVRLLCEAGANIHADYDAALLTAHERGHKDVSDYLINHAGADGTTLIGHVVDPIPPDSPLSQRPSKTVRRCAYPGCGKEFDEASELADHAFKHCLHNIMYPMITMEAVGMEYLDPRDMVASPSDDAIATPAAELATDKPSRRRGATRRRKNK
eukprot:GCRY01001143.1.p1 GENE.GCRY01001143.1~~GCRY01001143.1.p1  ORF type:complete len:429 (-),score=106.07 GCRY01001143.1:710-1996(-)